MRYPQQNFSRVQANRRAWVKVLSAGILCPAVAVCAKLFLSSWMSTERAPANGHSQAPQHSSASAVPGTPVPAHVNGESTENWGDGEWVEGQLGQLQTSETD